MTNENDRPCSCATVNIIHLPIPIEISIYITHSLPEPILYANYFFKSSGCVEIDQRDKIKIQANINSHKSFLIYCFTGSPGQMRKPVTLQSPKYVFVPENRFFLLPPVSAVDLNAAPFPWVQSTLTGEGVFTALLAQVYFEFPVLTGKPGHGPCVRGLPFFRTPINMNARQRLIGPDCRALSHHFVFSIIIVKTAPATGRDRMPILYRYPFLPGHRTSLISFLIVRFTDREERKEDHSKVRAQSQLLNTAASVPMAFMRTFVDRFVTAAVKGAGFPDLSFSVTPHGFRCGDLNERWTRIGREKSKH